MIISKTPCRASFVGGGSDIPAFYLRHGGAVLSTAIDKYIYVAVNPKFDRSIRLSYSRTEEVETVDQIDHALLRETLKMLEVEGGVEIVSIADIPSKGTGLGSSSSFTVGLINSILAYKNVHASAEKLAHLSTVVEIERCGQPIGKQDQYAAAFGGFNLIKFNTDGSVTVTPIVCKRGTVDQLQDNLLMFYTGIVRDAGQILKKQTEAMTEDSSAVDRVKQLVALTDAAVASVRSGDLDAMGEILHESWMIKRKVVAKVTDDGIDQWYQIARRAGAIGGKLLGAGGGGFFLLYAPPARHAAIEAALGNLRRVPFRFEKEGSRIIFYNPTSPDRVEEVSRLIA